MMFNFSVILFLVGLALAIMEGAKKNAWIIILVCGVMVAINYVLCTAVLYGVVLESTSLMAADNSGLGTAVKV